MTVSAVVLVPAVHFDLFTSQCLAYCAARGYEVVGVVVGDWAGALNVLANEAATVLVVARQEHLDPQREPRIEVAAEYAGNVADPRHDNGRPASMRKRRAHRI